MCWISHFSSLSDLKVVAFANLTEPGDAVQIVGGNRLVLLFKEPKDGEGEARMLAVSILMHDCHWVPRTPVTWGGGQCCYGVIVGSFFWFEDLRNKQVEESAVGGIWRHRSIASIQEHVVPGGEGCQDLFFINITIQAVCLGSSFLVDCHFSTWSPQRYWLDVAIRMKDTACSMRRS